MKSEVTFAAFFVVASHPPYAVRAISTNEKQEDHIVHSNSLLMILLIVTILSLTCSVEVTYGSVIAHWRFEEGDPNSAASGSASVVDSSGHNLHGTPVNGPIYRADVAANPVPQTGTENTLMTPCSN